MNGSDQVGFHKLGEIFRFLVKCAGVLPAKRDQLEVFDEKQRSNLRKLLERLAKEEGNLQENSGEARKELAFLVAGYVRPAAINFAIGEVIEELLEVYGAVVRDEGSFLSRHDTLRWMIAKRWAPALAVSVARAMTRFDLRSFRQYFPDCLHWYLPDASKDRVIWPLTKVMRWIYAQSGTSQIQFHQHASLDDDGGADRDLENAQNWASGGEPPSAAALAWTFARGFAAHGFTAVDSHGVQDEHGKRYEDGAQMALFIARWITYGAKKLEKEFGRELLQSVCETFQRTLDMAMEEAGHVEDWINRSAREHGVSPRDPYLRDYAVTCWNHQLRARIGSASPDIEALHEADALNEQEVTRMVGVYGPLAVLPAVEEFQASANHTMSPEFVTACSDGEQLAKNRELTAGQVEDYVANLGRSGMDAYLPWMAPWLRFLVCYRSGDDITAWSWIEQAYEAARYCAGARQYQIVNHYVELAAKMNKGRAFRKGALWAAYIGLEIRWLRDKQLTRENLDDAMAMLRIARYPV